MAMAVNMGAQCMCTFGTGPAPIKVTSQSKVLEDGKPAATIQDAAPLTNVGPFAMCTTQTNPAVSAATAAALGVPTPAPCVPVTAGMWIQPNTKVLIDGKPILTQDCKLMCTYGGQITITNPGQTKVMT